MRVNIVLTSHKSPLDVRPTTYRVGPVSASIFGGINLESSVDLERREVTDIGIWFLENKSDGHEC